MTEESIGVGIEGLMSPDDAVFGNDVARIIVALGKELRAIHKARVTQHAGHRGDARQVARIASEVRHTLARRFHRCVQTCDLNDIAPRSLAERDALRAVFCSNALELALDNVVRLIPRDAFELVLAAIFPSALHRVEQTVLMIDVIGNA